MVLGELLPNVNELFEWKGIFGRNTALEFNKVALMAFVSTFICIALFWVGGTPKAKWEAAGGDAQKLPSLHSPFWAPDAEAVISTATEALTLTALDVLKKG